MDDENGESMEPMGEEPLVGLVESELERLGLVHGCTGADLGFYKGGCPIHLKGAPPPPIILTHVTGSKQFFGLRRKLSSSGGRTTSRATCMSNPLLSSYSSCFVFTKHRVQLKTVTTCFQNMFFSKRAPKQKGG